MSLQDERARLSREMAKGTTCAACGQHVQSYRRSLYGAMVGNFLNLVVVWLPATREYVHVRDFESRRYQRGGDFAKLAFWGLVEAAPNDNPKKRCSGLWRPTKHGLAFATGKVRVPRTVILYNNQPRGFLGPFVAITEVLPEGFDYQSIREQLE